MTPPSKKHKAVHQVQHSNTGESHSESLEDMLDRKFKQYLEPLVEVLNSKLYYFEQRINDLDREVRTMKQIQHPSDCPRGDHIDVMRARLESLFLDPNLKAQTIELLAGRAKSKLISKVLKAVFTVEDLASSTLTGKDNTQQLDPEKMKIVKEYIALQTGFSDTEINNKIRDMLKGVRRVHEKKQNKLIHNMSQMVKVKQDDEEGEFEIEFESAGFAAVSDSEDDPLNF